MLSACHKLSAPSAYVMSIPSANPRFTISQIHKLPRVSTHVTLTLQTPLLFHPTSVPATFPLWQMVISLRLRRPSARARTRSREHISAVTTFDQHDLFESSPSSHRFLTLPYCCVRSPPDPALTFASTTPLLPPECALFTMQQPFDSTIQYMPLIRCGLGSCLQATSADWPYI